MPTYYCLECCRPTEHLNVTRAAARIGVMRATVYRWIKLNQVHTILHPSGRTFVCTASLLTPGFSRYPAERAAAVPWSPDRPAGPAPELGQAPAVEPIRRIHPPGAHAVVLPAAHNLASVETGQATPSSH